MEVLEEISDDSDLELDEINILIAANNDRTCLLIKQVFSFLIQWPQRIFPLVEISFQFLKYLLNV